MADTEKKFRGSTQKIVINITAETNTGGRPYMEDYLAVELEANEESQQLPHLKEQAFVGVFDGHGGQEAAMYARDRLWQVIQKQPKFRLTDPEGIKEALREAYVALHEEMEPLRATWKRHSTGELSTAGTTASTVIFRGDHIFVANVGDSTAVLAVNNPHKNQIGQHPVKAIVLTKDHKAEDPDEIRTIKGLGGSVRTSRKGIRRVCWERERKESRGVYDCIPFLGVSRSLGDFWSLSHRTQKFTVSPKPDVYAHKLNLEEQKFVVIASDGLWNVMSPDEVVRFIWDYQRASDKGNNQPKDVVKAVIRQALERWAGKLFPADNIAVLIAFLSESKSGSKGKGKQHSTAMPRNNKTMKDCGEVEQNSEDNLLNHSDAIREGVVVGLGEDGCCESSSNKPLSASGEMQEQRDHKIANSLVTGDAAAVDFSLKSEETGCKAFSLGSQDISLEPVDDKEIEEIFYDTEDGMSALTQTFRTSDSEATKFSDHLNSVPTKSDDDDTKDVPTADDDDDTKGVPTADDDDAEDIITTDNTSEAQDILSFSNFDRSEKGHSKREKVANEQRSERPPRFRLGKRQNADCIQEDIQSSKKFKANHATGSGDRLGYEQEEPRSVEVIENQVRMDIEETMKEGKKIDGEDSGVHSDDAAGSENLTNTVKVCPESMISSSC